MSEAVLSGGNGTSERKCEKHDLEIAVLQTKIASTSKTLEIVPELTTHVAELAVSVTSLKDSIDKLTECETKQATTNEKIVEELTNQKTKVSVLWYVTFVIIASAVIAKVVIPLLGL